MKHVKIAAAHAADEAWLRNVLDLIPDSVYGRTKDNPAEETGPTEVVKEVKPKKKSKSRTKKKGKKVTEMPEKMAELQAALREKIESKRAERKADDADCIERRAAKKRTREEKKAEARKNEHKRRKKANEAATTGNDEQEGEDVAVEEAAEANVAQPEVMEIGGVRVEGDKVVDSGTTVDGGEGKSKKRPRSKKKLTVLEKQLHKAVELRDAEDAEVRQEAEMDKALARAKGETVKDDIGKLRKTIRKEKRRPEKSREEWTKRIAAAKADKENKQQQKENNLKERREGKGKGKKDGGKKNAKAKGGGKKSKVSKK